MTLGKTNDNGKDCKCFDSSMVEQRSPTPQIEVRILFIAQHNTNFFFERTFGVCVHFHNMFWLIFRDRLFY